ncbi:MAG: hypothetical protein Q7S73_01710 [bacterium]|nr:hypothetical protein [bacterium]
MDKKEIIWQAPEFEFQHKDASWYWLTIIVSAILALVALWQLNFLFAIFVVLAETMLIFWAKETPKILQFKISDRGIQLGRLKSYSFEELDGFHISELRNQPELVLKTRNKLHPYVIILMLEDDAPEIKEFLKNHLAEIEYEESLSDHLFKRIGF